MGFLDRLRRQDDKFHQLLVSQARVTLEALENLVEFMETGDDRAGDRVQKAEKEADELRRILIDELNSSFVTPFDREDIFALSRAIDDVLDYSDTTVDEMRLLEIEPNTYLRRMTSLLRDAGNEIHMAMLRIQDHPNVALDHATRAKALENRVENVYREAIADLFSGPEDIHHVMEMLKLRETYRHLSNAADRGDEAANIIGDIVVKMM